MLKNNETIIEVIIDQKNRTSLSFVKFYRFFFVLLVKIYIIQFK